MTWRPRFSASSASAIPPIGAPSPNSACVIDLLGVVGYYNFLAIVMNATRTALPANVPEPLKRYPE